MKRIIHLLFIFIAISSKAQDIINLEKSDESIPIGKKVYVYEDKTRQKDLTINEVAQDSFQKNFAASNKEVIDFYINKSIIWCKFKVTTQQQAEWLLEYFRPSNCYIDLYIFNHGKLVDTQKSGMYSYKERKVLGGHMLFNLNLKPNDTLTCYLRCEGTAVKIIHLTMGDVHTYFNLDRSFNIVHGMYFGISFLMILYNFFFLMTVKRGRVFLLYILYVFSTMMFIVFFQGYAFSLPDFMLKLYANHPALIHAPLGIFGSLFTVEFLNTKKYTPKLRIALISLVVISVIPITLSLLGFSQEGAHIIQIEGGIFAIISLITGVTIMRKGYRPAMFYVIGFGSYVLGLLIIILANPLHFTLWGFEDYSLETGSIIESVLLSFAIGDKLNIADAKRKQAQQEAFEALQKNEKLIREQNIILEEKVTERTAQLQEQKQLVEEKNKEITDSILYAKRIQHAMITSDEYIQQHVKNHFIFYQPKDIVSGDFYWAQQINNHFYLATADCTGHGVPGAFMSLLNISILNAVMLEKKITRADLVLNEARTDIIKALNPKGREESKDGMDCILAGFDFVNKKLQYAAANNSFYIVRNNELLVCKADKMPVGKSPNDDQPFTYNEVSLQKNDLVYMFTDGYADQFGGPKGKKFKYKQLEELLIANHSKPMNEQREILEKTFNNWKGALDQVDDVLLIGIKI